MKRSEGSSFINATAAAFELLRRLGITDPRDAALEDIAMAESVLVLEDRLVGAEARLLRGRKAGLIRVDSRIPEHGRRRFAIAHELGHWLLHGEVSQLAFCTGSEIHGYAGSHEELEANAFAAHLLMPSQFMRSRYTGAPTLRLVRDAAEDLGTTLSATAVRLVEILDDPCLVAFSGVNDGRVRWWRRSAKCPEVWLERRQLIEEGSVAKDMLAGGHRLEDPELVNPAVWFSHVNGHGQFTVAEESMLLGSYGTMLTLLTVQD